MDVDTMDKIPIEALKTDDIIALKEQAYETAKRAQKILLETERTIATLETELSRRAKASKGQTQMVEATLENMRQIEEMHQFDTPLGIEDDTYLEDGDCGDIFEHMIGEGHEEYE